MYSSSSRYSYQQQQRRPNSSTTTDRSSLPNPDGKLPKPIYFVVYLRSTSSRKWEHYENNVDGLKQIIDTIQKAIDDFVGKINEENSELVDQLPNVNLPPLSNNNYRLQNKVDDDFVEIFTRPSETNFEILNKLVNLISKERGMKIANSYHFTWLQICKTSSKNRKQKSFDFNMKKLLAEQESTSEPKPDTGTEPEAGIEESQPKWRPERLLKLESDLYDWNVILAACNCIGQLIWSDEERQLVAYSRSIEYELAMYLFENPAYGIRSVSKNEDPPIDRTHGESILTYKDFKERQNLVKDLLGTTDPENFEECRPKLDIRDEDEVLELNNATVSKWRTSFRNGLEYRNHFSDLLKIEDDFSTAEKEQLMVPCKLLEFTNRVGIFEIDKQENQNEPKKAQTKWKWMKQGANVNFKIAGNGAGVSKVRAWIRNVNGNFITVETDWKKKIQWTSEMKQSNWNMVEGDDVSITRMNAALNAIKDLMENKNDLLVRCLLGEPMPPTQPSKTFQTGTEPAAAVVSHPSNLNKYQEAAIRNILDPSSNLRMFALHGAFGTGKSTTILKIVDGLAGLKVTTRILISAPTNATTDRLLGSLTHLPGVVRIGKMPDEERLKDYHLDIQVQERFILENKNFLEMKEEARKAAQEDIRVKIVKEAKIVFTTCIGAGNKFLNGFYFSHVVIDEAAQCSEPESLVPISKVDRRKGKIIIAGDFLQLRPVIRSQMAKEQGLPQSLMERLVNTKSLEYYFLGLQYRCHPEIGTWASTEFYAGKLFNGLSAAHRHFPGNECLDLDLQLARNFYDVKNGRMKKDDEETGSKKNEEEADKVVDLVQRLLKLGVVKENQIVVLSPYSAQVRVIRGLLKGYQGVKVYTVHRYQGGENDILIVSTVRTGGTLGFVSDEKLINVLATRAKYKLFVVGQAKTLSKDPHWTSMGRSIRDQRKAATSQLSAQSIGQ